MKLENAIVPSCRTTIACGLIHRFDSAHNTRGKDSQQSAQ